MLAAEVTKAFRDNDWIFEVKWDGFRAIAYVRAHCSLKSRKGEELISKFPEAFVFIVQEVFLILEALMEFVRFCVYLLYRLNEVGWTLRMLVF